MVKIYINKIDYTSEAEGLEDIVESYSEKEDGSLEISQSSVIILTGSAYDYLKELVLDNSCETMNNEYDVRVFIQGCKINLEFILKSQGVVLDVQNCTAKLALNAKNEKEAAYQVLNSTYFWDEKSGFITQGLLLGSFVKMLHAHETGFLMRIVAILWFFIIVPILEVLNAIIRFINTILWFLPSDIDIEEIKHDDIDRDVAGGGEYSTPVLIKDILIFWANKAGLTFKSSIFSTDPYQNSVLWSMQYNYGLEISDHKTKHVDYENLPNLSPVQILNFLKPVFNAEWKIIGNSLYFERKDFFNGIRQKVFNLEQEIVKGTIEGEFEYTFNNEPNYSRFLGTFQTDSSDIQGNLALKYYRYNKEYNPGLIHKNRKGDRTIDIKFGGVRFTEDFDKSGFMSSLWNDLSPSLTHSIVIEAEIATLPKLIVLDSRDTIYEGTRFKTALRQQITAPTNKATEFDRLDLTGEWEYNIPFWLLSIYDAFHYIDDPDSGNKRIVEIQNLVWKPTDFCEAVEFLRLNKLNTYIETKIGQGNISNFEINYRNCTIKFENITFKCQ